LKYNHTSVGTDDTVLVNIRRQRRASGIEYPWWVHDLSHCWDCR